MQKVFRITVDISKKIPAPAFEVNTNDLKSVKLEITIANGLSLLDLTDVTPRINIRKPDNEVIFQDCEIVDAAAGKVQIVLENQAYLVPGTHTAEIACYKGSEITAITGTFSYKSLKGIMNDKAVESKSEFTAIDRKIAEARKLLEDIGENGVGVDEQARQEIEGLTERLAEKASQSDVEKVALKVASKVDIIGIGDSTMAGSSASGGSITLWLSHMLKKPIINNGVWGSWIEEVKDRLQTDVLDLHPKYCLILAGTNDLYGDRDRRLILTDAEAIADKLIEHQIQPIFISVAPRTDFPEVLPRIRRYNAMLMAMCQRKMIKFVDIYNPLSKSDGTSLDNIHANDKLHWATYGAFLAAKEIAKAFPVQSNFNNSDYPYNFFKGEYPTFENNIFEADTDKNGLANNWEAMDTANTTYTLETNPNGGKYQVINKTTTNTITSGIRAESAGLAANGTYRLETDIKFDYTDKTDQNIMTVVVLDFFNSSGGHIQGNTVLSVYKAQLSENFVLAKDFVVPAGTAKTRLSLWANGTTPFTLKIGRVYCYRTW